MTALPCTTRLDIYDALFDDAPAEQQATAHPIAVRLCASCPAPCEQQVTAATAPRTVPELPESWIPASVEGRAQYTGREAWHGRPYALRVYDCKCERCRSAHQPDAPVRPPRVTWPSSRAYVPPRDRIRVSALEAVGLEAKGMTVQQIADQMCVTVPTVDNLLRLAATGHRAA